MWFLFSIITLTVPLIICIYQRYKGLWKGIKTNISSKGIVYRSHAYRGRTHHILIDLDAPKELSFLIKKEKWWDMLFKKIKVSVEFQTGEDGFGEKYYLVADNVLVQRLMALASV